MKSYSQNDPLDEAFGKIRELPPSVSYYRVEDYVMRLAATGLPMAAAAKPAFIKFPFKSIYLNTALTMGIIGSLTVALVASFGSSDAATPKTAQLNFIPQVISAPTDTSKAKKQKLIPFAPIPPLAPVAPVPPCNAEPPAAPEPPQPPAAPNPNGNALVSIQMNNNKQFNVDQNDVVDRYAFAYVDGDTDSEDGLVATVDGDVVLAVGTEVEIPEPACVCNTELDEAFEKALLEDGLIKSRANYSFVLTEKYLKVNGKKQPDAIYQKYRKLYEDMSEEKINGEFSWARNVNSND